MTVIIYFQHGSFGVFVLGEFFLGTCLDRHDKTILSMEMTANRLSGVCKLKFVALQEHPWDAYL